MKPEQPADRSAETAPPGPGPADMARKVWATGDYATIADTFLVGLGERLVEQAGIADGERVLDVAAGVGNAAIPAAERGARVTALDIVPELVEEGRRRSEAAGVEVDWVVGDAAALPFEDGSFDVVISCIGSMFAQPHEQTAHELCRVLAPQGRLALLNWTPDGFVGRMFSVVGRHLPPPPGAEPPPLWGTREHARKLLEPNGLTLSFQLGAIEFRKESPEEWVDFGAEHFGPTRTAKERLEAEQGTWEPLREDLIAFTTEANEGDGEFCVDSEYLIVLGERDGAEA